MDRVRATNLEIDNIKIFATVPKIISPSRTADREEKPAGSKPRGGRLSLKE